MAEGLVDGAAFAVDASLIAADAKKQRSINRKTNKSRNEIGRCRCSEGYFGAPVSIVKGAARLPP
jgi:hypothetical protein